MLTYDTPALRQTGSRNLTGQKTLPTIWGTNMKLVTKYQISAINSCWEKCDEKCAYMFNVYKNQLSRQTGSRNLTGPKTLPTIWYTYMTLVTKYQISAINSYWEKCGSGGIKKFLFYVCVKITCHVEQTVNFGNAIKLFPLIMLTKEIFNWLATFHEIQQNIGILQNMVWAGLDCSPPQSSFYNMPKISMSKSFYKEIRLTCILKDPLVWF